MRIAIMAPIHVAGLMRYLSSPAGREPIPPGMGGYCINALVDARLQRGWPTDVITLDPAAQSDLIRLQGPLLRLWIARRRTRGALRDFFAAERRLLNIALEEAAPDLVHANWTYEFGLAATTQSRFPFVVSVHDHARHCLRWNWRGGWPLYPISRYVLAGSRHVTAVSPYVAGYVSGILRREIPVIPNMVPDAAWNPAKPLPAAGAPGRQTVVVSALNWSALKNTRNALQAFRRARDTGGGTGREWRYTLMGPGLEPGGPGEQWARAHQCDAGVEFCGRVPHETALRHIAGASVLFHSSHEEAMPGPVCEAMAMNVPVVACREAGGSRWLCGNQRGILCDGYDVAGMAAALSSALDPRPPCDTDGARLWIQELTSPATILDKWGHIYRQVCGA